jgi:cytochrome o ubiquinol oxidase subunit 1
VAFISVITATIIHTFNYDREYYIPAEEVEATEAKRTEQLEKGVLS